MPSPRGGGPAPRGSGGVVLPPLPGASPSGGGRHPRAAAGEHRGVDRLPHKGFQAHSPKPPPEPPVGRAPRPVARPARQPAPPEGQPPLQHRLRDLRRQGKGADLELLVYQEAQRRTLLDGEEAWARDRLARSWRQLFWDGVIVPRLRELTAREPGERRAVARAEIVDRTRYGNRREEIGQRLEILVGQKRAAVLLEAAQRAALSDRWRETAQSTAVTMQVAGAELAASERLAARRARMRRASARGLAAVSPLGEAEGAARDAVSGEEQCARSAALQRLRETALARLAAEERRSRGCVESCADGSLSAIVGRQEQLGRARVAAGEAAMREAARQSLLYGYGRRLFWDGEGFGRLVRIQRWARAVLRHTEGRTATRRLLRSECARHRRRKLIDQANAGVRGARERAASALQRAEAEAARHDAAALAAALGRKEAPARAKVEDDERWARWRLHGAHRYVLMFELVAPALRVLSAEGEPAGREKVDAAQAAAAAALSGCSNWLLGMARQCAALQQAERTQRAWQEEAEDAARSGLQDQSEGGLRAQEAGRRARAAALERERLQAQRRLSGQRRAAEGAELHARAALAGEEAGGRCCVGEARARAELARRQRRGAAAVVAQYGEAPARRMLMLSEWAARCALYEGLERAARYRGELAEEEEARHAVAALRRGLAAYDRHLVQFTPQVRRLQDFARHVRSGALGRAASRQWISRELRKLREERAAERRRQAVRLEVQQQRDKLQRAERALADDRAERSRVAAARIVDGEARERGKCDTEEAWLRRSYHWKHRSDAEAMVLEEMRQARELQTATRQRLQEQQEQHRNGILSLFDNGVRHIGIQPAQRAWRCFMARQRRRDRIEACLGRVAVDQSSQRIALAAHAEAAMRDLAELRARGAVEVAQISGKKTLVERWSAGARALLEQENAAERLRICVAAGSRFPAAFAAQQRASLLALQRDHGAAVSMLRMEAQEGRARRRVLLEEAMGRSEAGRELESSMRGARSAYARHALRRLWLAEQAHAAGALRIAAEREGDIDDQAASEEVFWRGTVERQRTADYRALYTKCGEATTRSELQKVGAAEFAELHLAAEYSARRVLEHGRDLQVRSLWQQRLEGLLRHQLGAEQDRAARVLFRTLETAERALAQLGEQRARERAALEGGEGQSRAVLDRGRWLAAAPLLEQDERRSRAPLAAATLADLALVMGSRAAIRQIFADTEDAARGAVDRAERTWRERLAAAERSLRLHKTVAPLQRAARAKLELIRQAQAARELLCRWLVTSGAIHEPEEQERCGLAESGARGAVAALEAQRRRGIATERVAAGVLREQAAVRREELRRTAGREHAARGVEAGAELARRAALVAHQEYDRREMLHGAEAAEGWVFTGEGDDIVRNSIARGEKVRRFELCAYEEASRLEPPPRQAIEVAAEIERGDLAVFEHWMRTAKGVVEEKEAIARQDVESLEQQGRQLFHRIDQGRRAHIYRDRDAAIVIQLAWRRYYAVATVQALHAVRVEALVAEEAEARDSAAVLLQAHWSGYYLRSSGLLDLLRKERDERTRAEEREQLENYAATVIQRGIVLHFWQTPTVRLAVREANVRRNTRDEMLEMRDFVECLHYYASRLQATWRMHRVRQHLVTEAFDGDWA